MHGKALLVVVAMAVSVATVTAQPHQRRLSRAERAHNDSYPRYEYRATLERNDPKVGRVLPKGQGFRVCILARNRYTRKAMLVIPREVSAREAAAVERDCWPVYEAYANERGS
jgi:hypothetical protein